MLVSFGRAGCANMYFFFSLNKGVLNLRVNVLLHVLQYTSVRCGLNTEQMWFKSGKWGTPFSGFFQAAEICHWLQYMGVLFCFKKGSFFFWFGANSQSREKLGGLKFISASKLYYQDTAFKLWHNKPTQGRCNFLLFESHKTVAECPFTCHMYTANLVLTNRQKC